jgi:hypothetical protein
MTNPTMVTGRGSLPLVAIVSVLVSCAVAAAQQPQAGPAPEAVLPPVTVTAPPPVASSSAQIIPGRDFELRPQGRPADVLRLIPGLIIDQHQGGGKAEQYILRGFDADHGTDLALFVDGVPVNLRSHAHGQGYADLHFLIPETVRAVDVLKGDRFGSIDPDEGGVTERTNLNLDYVWRVTDTQSLSLNAYVSHCRLTLVNDFTFFLDDPVSGDMITQRDEGFVAGLDAQYERKSQPLGLPLTSTAGVQYRIVDKVRLVAGARADVFTFDVKERVNTRGIVSPGRRRGRVPA